mgnify:CR=1 FL=1
MEYKKLGRTDVMIPTIGLGTWKYTGGVMPLRRGIDLGANLIDTAEMYKTEDAVGDAISGIRNQVLVATKVSGSHITYDEIMRAAKRSLRQLGVSSIDLYQVHWPNSNVPIGETMRAMEELVDVGVVKHIGVSNFSVRDLEEARGMMSKYPIVSNQVLYNLNKREIERELLYYCMQNHITILAYTPLASGSLSNTSSVMGGVKRIVGKGDTSPGGVLKNIADEVGKTPAQVALNWCTAHPNVVAIPKANTVKHTEENCEAVGWYLSEDQMRRLDRAFPLKRDPKVYYRG